MRRRHGPECNVITYSRHTFTYNGIVNYVIKHDHNDEVENQRAPYNKVVETCPE
jgi:hypothetical protein